LLHKDSALVAFILVEHRGFAVAPAAGSSATAVLAGASLVIALTTVRTIVAIIERRTRASTASTSVEISARTVIITTAARAAAITFAAAAAASASLASVSTAKLAAWALHVFIAIDIAVRTTASLAGTGTLVIGVCTGGAVITVIRPGGGLGGGCISGLQESLDVESRHDERRCDSGEGCYLGCGQTAKYEAKVTVKPFLSRRSVSRQGTG
jgi:hypothetical protein